jgi:hypothetical protein
VKLRRASILRLVHSIALGVAGLPIPTRLTDVIKRVARRPAKRVARLIHARDAGGDVARAPLRDLIGELRDPTPSQRRPLFAEQNKPSLCRC